MTTAAVARTGHPVRVALHSVRLAPYRAAALAAAAVAGDQVLDPTHTHVPLCPLHALTGIWCPFCGGLRSAYELTRLHLGAALHDNVLFVVSLPLLAVLWLDWVVRARKGQPRRTIDLPRVARIALLVGVLAFTLLRNLPIGAGLR